MNAVETPRKLLVIDDEPLVRDSLRFCLQDSYAVTAVASGEQALETSRRELFPVVILDLRMEGMSGIETLRHLKQLRETQNIIILTAHESMETAISALNCGAFNYLTKPFERERLRRVIASGFSDFEARTRNREEMRQRLMGIHDDFFALLCHEFNTPLNIILGFAELLATGVREPDHARWVRDIGDAGSHLHELLMEMVDYIAASHLAASGVRKGFQPMEIFESVKRRFADRGIGIRLEAVPGTRQTLAGYPESVRMIMQKMVNVASRYSTDLVVRMGVDSHDNGGGDRLEITVVARGVRNTSRVAEDPASAFTSGRMAERSATEGGMGMGMGIELAACRRIAEYAGGTVKIEQAAPGQVELTAALPVHLGAGTNG